jgi:hypothetical protein
MRPQQCGRHLRGSLDGAPPGEIRGLRIAQACGIRTVSEHRRVQADPSNEQRRRKH